MATMTYKLRDKAKRNKRLYQFWKEHPDWTYDSIGAVFHISGQRAWQIIHNKDGGDGKR